MKADLRTSGVNNLEIMDVNYEKYERAKKRVKEIRGFYSHVRIYVLVITLIFITRFYLLPKFGVISEEEDFIDWMNWNTYLVPAFWGIGLLIHGLSVYRFKFVKHWEDKKIKEFMEKEEQKSSSNWK